MPIYEYKCDGNGHVREFLVKLSDPEPTECDICHTPLTRLISRTNFQLKGSGWYVTDYQRAAKEPATQSTKDHSDTTTQKASDPAKVSPSRSTNQESSKNAPQDTV